MRGVGELRMSAMEWRPIETIPPYTEVLVYFRGLGITQATYHDMSDTWSLGALPSFGGYLSPWAEPTHWMPLPERPKDLSNSKEFGETVTSGSITRQLLDELIKARRALWGLAYEAGGELRMSINTLAEATNAELEAERSPDGTQYVFRASLRRAQQRRDPETPAEQRLPELSRIARHPVSTKRKR